MHNSHHIHMHVPHCKIKVRPYKKLAQKRLASASLGGQAAPVGNCHDGVLGARNSNWVVGAGVAPDLYQSSYFQ